jgi:hypothetical protein
VPNYSQTARRTKAGKLNKIWRGVRRGLSEPLVSIGGLTPTQVRILPSPLVLQLHNLERCPELAYRSLGYPMAGSRPRRFESCPLRWFYNYIVWRGVRSGLSEPWLSNGGFTPTQVRILPSPQTRPIRAQRRMGRLAVGGGAGWGAAHCVVPRLGVKGAPSSRRSFLATRCARPGHEPRAAPGAAESRTGGKEACPRFRATPPSGSRPLRRVGSVGRWPMP